MKSIYFIVILFMFAGCKESISKRESDAIVIYPLREIKEVDDLYDYIESVELVPLETNENSLISLVAKMHITDEGDFILLNFDMCKKFDSQGNFITSFGTTGRGPGEYTFVANCCINQFDNSLMIYNPHYKVIKYNLKDGSFVEETLLKDDKSVVASYLGVLPASDNGFYLYSDCPTNKDDKEENFYRLRKFNENGEFVQGFLPTKHFEDEHYNLGCLTQSYDKSYFINCTETDNLHYKFLDDEIKEFVIIDYEDKAIKSNSKVLKYKKSEVSGDYERYINSNYFKKTQYFQETKDFLYFMSEGPQKMSYYNIYSFEKKEGITWLVDRDNHSVLRIIGSDNSYFYCLIDDYDYSQEELIEFKDPLKKVIFQKAGIPPKSENDVPYIVKIKFKI